MNNLSWLIYFGGVCDGLEGLFVSLSVLGGLVVVIQSLNNEKLTILPIVKLVPLLWVVAAILPTKDTVYAIAASELGEKVVASQLSDKAKKAIDAWLDKQIKGEKNERSN